jgi:hypothetical protein
MPINPRRRDEIVAAVAAYNVAGRRPLLPPAATNLLTIMFADADVCQRSLASLAQEGFYRTVVAQLLRRLLEAGFLSKQRGSACIPGAYRLHLRLALVQP